MDWSWLEDQLLRCVHPRCIQPPVGSYMYRGRGLGERIGWRIDRCCEEHAAGYGDVIEAWNDPQSSPTWVPGDVECALDAVRALFETGHDYFVSVGRPVDSVLPD